jgi:predicted RNase H-like nuclease
MTTTFIGIDLAWKSDRNPTGLAVLTGDRSGASLNQVETLHPEVSVLDFIRHTSTENTVVAIDAPLIITNETGQRRCETEVGRRYGAREASCHTSNLTLYKDASSVALTAQLVAGGFSHVNLTKQRHSGRLIAEVYPHAAMVALWDLPKIIKYKKGSVATRRVGLETLRCHLRELVHAEPPLKANEVLRDELTVNLEVLRGRALKDYEIGSMRYFVLISLTIFGIGERNATSALAIVSQVTSSIQRFDVVPEMVMNQVSAQR